MTKPYAFSASSRAAAITVDAARKVLPEWLLKHVLVAFHDESNLDSQHAAKGQQTPAERELQASLRTHTGDYPSTDTVVLGDFGRADGVTSWDKESSDIARAARPDLPRVELHRPVLDIDLPAVLIPSSTEGHFHLVIDKLIPWDSYLELLNVLADVGIIESGYVEACEDQGYSSVRLPWVKK